MLKYILILIASTTICFGQQLKCKLFYVNETKVDGFCNVPKNNEIEFSVTDNGKVETLGFNTVKKLIIYDKKPAIYEYFKVTQDGNPILLKLLTGNGVYFDNEAILYTSAKEANSAKTESAKKQDLTYYLKKRFDDEFVVISHKLTAKQWKKKMLTYFKDCPIIVETLRFGGFNKKSMPKMIEEYNVYCD